MQQGSVVLLSSSPWRRERSLVSRRDLWVASEGPSPLLLSRSCVCDVTHHSVRCVQAVHLHRGEQGGVTLDSDAVHLFFSDLCQPVHGAHICCHSLSQQLFMHCGCASCMLHSTRVYISLHALLHALRLHTRTHAQVHDPSQAPVALEEVASTEVLSELSPSQLASAVWHYAKQGCPQIELMHALLAEVHFKLGQFRYALVLLRCSLSCQGLPPPTLMPVSALSTRVDWRLFLCCDSVSPCGLSFLTLFFHALFRCDLM